ncbi:SDR family NAD(P)-dependent oxidoreductase [Aneurinibacillus thermoaerophilus]|uniref:SDR family NAD(P)-dependent oxidoreductase n=1 Tax=Aneurinibacillus thermoaerophilus TaxID=143495 RepID=UPI002E215157|nr:SDR family NAD(P)-dependent oxidoreductase [Aneurinibacillus thermoaerophilus]
MKKALVLGASGGMGYALVHELVARGIETVAFARTREKLEKLFGHMEQVTIVSGDVYQVEDVKEAGRGVEVIFHTVSVPYPEWEKGHPTIMRNVVEAAAANCSKIVLIDNIYAYGRGNGQPITEEYPKRPHTKKGNIRLQIDHMAKDAHRQGIPALIVHFPDFYGPNATNTLLSYTLESMVAGKKAAFVGNQNVKREYIFTPDGAKATVELALREDAYGQNWNIPGYGVISGREIISIVKEITGYSRKVGTIGRGMITLAGLFSRMMWEVREMMYLTEEPVVLSGAKYEKHIGPLPKTSYEEGIRQTLNFMKGVRT